MKIPKKLKIGGHTFKVIQDPKLNAEKSLLGQCDTTINEIRIDSTANQTQKEATLIHEIFHSLNTTYDSGYAHALMDSLAEQFYQVLKENKLIK